MPSGTFDADDLADAADSVARAGERFDVGSLLGAGRATVDALELASAAGRARGPVRISLTDSGPASLSWRGGAAQLRVER